jgi:hypothetical protein
MSQARQRGLQITLRHMTRPVVEPDGWLTEELLGDRQSLALYSPHLKAGRPVINLEYSKPRRVSGPPGVWIVFANRALSKNDFQQIL